MDPSLIVLRSIERLTGIVIGGFLTWLGYRLFLDVQASQDSSGKFVLPGGTAIHLTRVGPGVFFSLFGTAIVLSSFLKPVDYQQSTDTAGTTTVKYSAAVPGSQAPDKGRQNLRNLRQSEIAVLNGLEDQLRPDLDPSRRNDIRVAIPQLKLAVMETVWGNDWGDFARFTEWVHSGEPVPPAGLEKAAEYFNRKSP